MGKSIEVDISQSVITDLFYFFHEPTSHEIHFGHSASRQQTLWHGHSGGGWQMVVVDIVVVVGKW